MTSYCTITAAFLVISLLLCRRLLVTLDLLLRLEADAVDDLLGLAPLLVSGGAGAGGEEEPRQLAQPRHRALPVPAPGGQGSPLLGAVVEAADGALTRARHEPDDGEEDSSDGPARLPGLLVVARHREADLLTDLKSPVRL